MANEVNRREFLVRTAAVAGATTGAALLQAWRTGYGACCRGRCGTADGRARQIDAMAGQLAVG